MVKTKEKVKKMQSAIEMAEAKALKEKKLKVRILERGKRGFTILCSESKTEHKKQNQSV